MMCCASCGIAEVDDIKLKKCTDCDLVRYCSDRCQREHRTKHEAICIRRAAELRDEILFRQPEGTDQGDCPICFLPFPIDVYDYTLLSCCSKLICNGCAYAHTLRTKTEENPLDLCPFCRQPIPGTQEQMDQIVKKRIEANDPVEILRLGSTHLCEGDYERAFEYYTKAVGLGNIEAFIVWEVCIGRDKASRWTSKRKYTIWRRLPLATISTLGIILHVMRGETKRLIEQ